MILNKRYSIAPTKYPKHWKQIRGKYLFNILDTRSTTGTEELLSVSHISGITPRRLKNVTMFKAESNVGDKVCLTGDIAANTMWTWQGAIGVSRYDGIVSPAYNVYRQKEDNYNLRFLDILLREKNLIDIYRILSFGLRPSRLRLYPEQYLDIYFPVPPRAEQDQIVKYLDWQTSKINTFIKAKKKQIELLKEQRQAIINKAVTKGLDDTVPMKDSGVEWLGEVPEHWEVNRLKRFCKVNASISNMIKNYADNDQLVFLPMEKVSVNGEIDCSEKRLFKDVKSGYSSFAKNDVVIAKITPCFENGKGAYLDKLETDIGYGTTEFITIRAYAMLNPKYLYLITMTQYFRLNGEEQMTGSAGQKRVSSDFVANFIQGVPPFEEQQSIVTYLEAKTTLIDKAITVIEKEIELVTEYKTSLISSVVTGKVDVQGMIIPAFEVVEDATEDMENEEMEE